LSHTERRRRADELSAAAARRVKKKSAAAAPTKWRRRRRDRRRALEHGLLYVTAGRPSVRLVIRQLLQRAAGLLLSAPRTGHIDLDNGGRRRPAARRSAANAGSVALTAELTRLNTVLWIVQNCGCDCYLNTL